MNIQKYFSFVLFFLFCSINLVRAASQGETYKPKPKIPREYKLELLSEKFIKMGNSDPAILLYSPSGKISVVVPEIAKKNSDGAIVKKNGFVERGSVGLDEIGAYRNLACNPYDWQEKAVSFYPHASSNSECRSDPMFAARNAINGLTKNDKHGSWEDRSWGPEKIKDPWLEIDFGHLVEVDKVVIFIRADFPHDGYWQTGKLEFSDGSVENISFQKIAAPQTFTFSKRKITKIRLTDLVQPEPLMWCAISEIQVFGKEVLPMMLHRTLKETLEGIKWDEKMAFDEKMNWILLVKHFPLESDWLKQDLKMNLISFVQAPDRDVVYQKMKDNILNGVNGKEIAEKLRGKTGTPLSLYLEACAIRRRLFLVPLEQKFDTIVFVKRYPMRPSFYGYTEGLSDGRGEVNFIPGSALCFSVIKGGIAGTTTLLEDPNGAIRDPDVSYDGKRILFAWKKSLNEDDYHLYEMEFKTRKIKQLTFGDRHADFEGKYLPNGDIIFNSTRCEQAVDCFNTDVSNLYLIRQDGSYLRRIGFDQVQTTSPSVMENGKIIYTRWDYNDRGQTFPQPLFEMNMDGTGQTEFYGNNSWYPTVIVHARQIPGTDKVMATLCGHHSPQRGQLAIIDNTKGRQEADGIQLIAPVRAEKPQKIDTYGQTGSLFKFPYPISEDYFLVTYKQADEATNKDKSPFFLYAMDKDANREIIAWDVVLDCKQGVPLKARKAGHITPARVDYTKKTGTFFVQDVYSGAGSKGIKRGSIEKIRVVALDFRAAPVGANGANADFEGIPTANSACTPIALGQGAWDIKKILGETPVQEDGSALFEVPARTPVYFQLIDTAGYVAQTMRSWSTLQPGESFSCIGCHEDKNEPVPTLKKKAIALGKGVQKLLPFYDVTQGFSFRREIQPILNKHCISCHNDRSIKILDLGKLSVADLSPAKNPDAATGANRAFSLLDNPVEDKSSGRKWNDAYLNLLRAFAPNLQGQFLSGIINWPGMQSPPTLLPPYLRGSATSKLMKMVKNSHGKCKLSRKEHDMIACWIDLAVPFCGDYKEENTWSVDEMNYYDYYLNKRIRFEKEESASIQDFLKSKEIRTSFDANQKTSKPDNKKFISPQFLLKIGGELIISDITGKQLIVFDVTSNKVVKKIPLKVTPGELAADGLTSGILVTSSEPDGKVLFVDLKNSRIINSVKVGHTPVSMATSKNLAFVGNKFSNDISVVDLNLKKEIKRIPVVRVPVDICLTLDGNFLLVANALPLMAGTENHIASKISVINTKTLEKIKDILLPNGSTGLKGICVSPDGLFAYCTHILARYQYPTTQIEKGWMNANAVSIIDLQKMEVYNTLLLDDLNAGAANPWAVECSKDGNQLIVSLAGTDEICIINRVKLHQRLSGMAGGEGVNYGSASNIKNDYSLLSDIKKRVKLNGKGPRGLAVADDMIYVSEYFTGTIDMLSLNNSDYQVKSCSLGIQPGQTLVRKGEQYFNDADFCFQKWQSCVSCHPDVRTDGLNWDLLNDGIGNPKNTKSLVYSHFTPPAMITGIRPNAEAGVRAGLKYIQFAQRPEADAQAIDFYLKSLKQTPSPFLENGSLSKSAERGKLLFKSADCMNCHSGPYLTDLNKYSVGTSDGLEKATEFDTPSLNEIWRNAPYLYDGRALTLKEVLTTFNLHDRHGRTSHLSGQELNDLIQYLNSL
jgi:hypothetical protein